MLSEQEWVKLLPQIREALEKAKGSTTRWGHRPLWRFVLQLVTELEETRDLLSRQGWVHQKDVLGRIDRATDKAYSAASDVEQAAEELKDAAEELLDPTPRETRLRYGPALDELMRLIFHRHAYAGRHPKPFRYCNDPICREANRLNE